MKYKVIKDFYMEYKEVPEYTVNQVFDFVLRDGRIVMPDDGHGVPHYFDYDDEFLEHFELVDEQTP